MLFVLNLAVYLDGLVGACGEGARGIARRCRRCRSGAASFELITPSAAATGGIRRVSSLDPYRAKRDPKRTPEPVPPAGSETTRPRRRKRGDPAFVIQEHHARSLHWDFRLERDGVLVSWAVPKGLPTAPGRQPSGGPRRGPSSRVRELRGQIPDHEYGAGGVTIWDRGTYESTNWTDRDVKVTLHGERVEGRYGLFQTNGQNWMIHRIDPASARMGAAARARPPDARDTRTASHRRRNWAYEFKWDGVRAIVYVDGGRVRTLSRTDRDVTTTYPELRGLGEALGSLQAVLDGEIVALDDKGRPSFEALQPRMNTRRAEPGPPARRQHPGDVHDLRPLHLDGHSALEVPYSERRRLLEGLKLAGPHWATPPSETGNGCSGPPGGPRRRARGHRGETTRQPLPARPAGPELGEGEELPHPVGGHRGLGDRAGPSRRRSRGAAAGDPRTPAALTYAGRVGTGFTRSRTGRRCVRLLKPLRRDTSPFKGAVPRSEAAGVTWVEPKLVGEVQFSEWTRTGRLRQPSWRGLRPDQRPGGGRP